MGGKDEFTDILSRDDSLMQLDAIEKESGKKMDEGSREATGAVSGDAVKLDENMRIIKREYIINRAPSPRLEDCLSGLPVAVLRDMINFIFQLVEEAQPPNEFFLTMSLNKKNPKEMAVSLAKAKRAYISALGVRKKKDLAADAYRLLSERAVVKAIMLGMIPESRKAYSDAINGGQNYSIYAVTLGLMYMFGGKMADGSSSLLYIVPDEMKEIWMSLPETALKMFDTACLYTAAAANLYGVIPLSDLVKLMRRYDTPDRSETVPVSIAALTDVEILLKINMRSLDDSGFQLFPDERSGELYIVSERYLLYMEEMFPDAENYGDFNYSKIKDKPRYFPSKSEFLKYADPHYYEQTPESAALRTYIKKKFGKQLDKYVKLQNKKYEGLYEPVTPESDLDDIMETLHDLFASGDVDFEDMAYSLFTRNIHISDSIELYKYINAAREHTRAWYNKGYPAGEELHFTEMNSNTGTQKYQWVHDNIDSLTPGPAEDKPAEILPMPEIQMHGDIDITDKTGRNDLCPCGSGKKYKKCCGR